MEQPQRKGAKAQRRQDRHGETRRRICSISAGSGKRRNSCGSFASLRLRAFAIQLCALEIHAAVGKIERLVDERKIRNDVADHRMLQHRPVLPGRIVRVHAMQLAVRRRFPVRSALRRASPPPSRCRRRPQAGSGTGSRTLPSGMRLRILRHSSRDSSNSSNRTSTRAATSPVRAPAICTPSLIVGYGRQHARADRRPPRSLARPARSARAARRAPAAHAPCRRADPAGPGARRR